MPLHIDRFKTGVSKSLSWGDMETGSDQTQLYTCICWTLHMYLLKLLWTYVFIKIIEVHYILWSGKIGLKILIVWG